MKTYSRKFLFSKTRYKLCIIVVSITIETLLLSYYPIIRPASFTTTFNTGMACLGASVIAILLARGVGRYPGVEESSYLAPSLTISYGLLILVFLMLRVPYSRLLIACTFVTSLFLLSILYGILRRSTRITIGVVPEGQYRNMTALPQVDWQILEQPKNEIDGIDAVSVDLRSELPDEWDRRLADFALEGIPVYDLKHLRESLTGKVQIEHLSESTFGTLSPLYAWMTIKQVIDWLAALVAALLLSPVLAIVAVLIKIDSPGPVLFSQIRVGYRGKPFRVFKLRTMIDASESACDEQDSVKSAVTKDRDSRITRMGRFLRRSRIDELPQLINVLRGEMSWIGPRPEAQILSQWYESEIPFYRYRHIVRPGITGWAQVNQGHVADIKDVTDKLHFDFYYIKHFSPWIDFVVVARTIRTMMTGFGAR